MKSIANQESYLQYRINTFKNSGYEKLRNKCASKKMAEAGFYLTPNENDPERVTCYACGIDLTGINKKADDPWTLHQNKNNSCMYLQKKKSYSNELTVYEFIEIEKYRYIRLNNEKYECQKQMVINMLENESNKDTQNMASAIGTSSGLVCL